jgi:hypothetical protein
MKSKKISGNCTGTVMSKSTPICHSRKRSASGILLQTKKDSGQAGMTDKKLKTKKRLLQQRVSFNNDMTVLYWIIHCKVSRVMIIFLYSWKGDSL